MNAAKIIEIKASSRTLNNAINELEKLFVYCFKIRTLEINGTPRERFDQLIANFKTAFESNKTILDEFMDDNDIKTSDELSEFFQNFNTHDTDIEVDDISPNEFFEAIELTIADLAKDEAVKIPYNHFLRKVYGHLCKKHGCNFNAGTNRHLIRTTQWVLEFIVKQKNNDVPDLRLVYLNFKPVLTGMLFSPKKALLIIPACYVIAD